MTTHGRQEPGEPYRRISVEEAVEMYLARLIVEIVGKGGTAHPRALEAFNFMRLARGGMT